MGVKPARDGFRLTPPERETLLDRGVPRSCLPRLIAGSDITRHPQNRFVIDVYGMSESQLKETQPILYQHLSHSVRPEREQLKRKSYRDLWWIFAEPRPHLRRALRSLQRTIITSEVSKHPTFVFVDLINVQFDGSVIVISDDDAILLGVLSSKFHSIWKHKAGGTLEDRPRYQSFRVFDPFPFPIDVPDSVDTRVRVEAEVNRAGFAGGSNS